MSIVIDLADAAGNTTVNGGTDDNGSLSGPAKAIYDKLVAKGVKPAVARKMALKAAAKAGSADDGDNDSDAVSTTRRGGRVVRLAGAGDLSTDARNTAADKGQAMSDGSYPVRNLAELDKARQAFGRANPADRGKLKAFLLRRAKALGAGQDVIDAIQAYST
jgi:hypothetical protein